MNLAQAAIGLQKFFITFKISSFACMAWDLPGKISYAAGQYVPFNCSLNICPSDAWIHTQEKGDALIIVVSDAHVHCHLREPISGILYPVFSHRGKGFWLEVDKKFPKPFTCRLSYHIRNMLSCMHGVGASRETFMHSRSINACSCKACMHACTHTRSWLRFVLFLKKCWYVKVPSEFVKLMLMS